jgi:hypothetical protein
LGSSTLPLLYSLSLVVKAIAYFGVAPHEHINSAEFYASDGWRVDAAAVATMAACGTPEQHGALLGTLDVAPVATRKATLPLRRWIVVAPDEITAAQTAVHHRGAAALPMPRPRPAQLAPAPSAPTRALSLIPD